MKNDIKWKQGGYCILLILGIYLFFTISGNTQAFARTNDEVASVYAATDLGHGAGCQHTHSSGCYSHTHSSTCLSDHYWVLYCFDPCYSDCVYCGINKRMYGHTFICNKCNLTYLQETCVQCDTVKYGSNYYTRCSANKCNIPTTELICTLTGYTDCITPSTTIQRSITGWTNQNVTCTGQCPTFTFTDGNPQTVVFTSSSGHRVQETIASNVDKLAPDMPTYQIE